LLRTPTIALHDCLTEDQRRRGEQERKTEYQIDQAARRFAAQIKAPQDNQRHDACRDAAAGKPGHRRPVDAPRPTVRQAATGLGGGGGEQIGADRGRRVDTEQQDQQWRHQGATADSCHADQKADAESRNHIEGFDHEYILSASIRRRPISIPMRHPDTKPDSCGPESFN
jgi:hypothetical protein